MTDRPAHVCDGDCVTEITDDHEDARRELAANRARLEMIRHELSPEGKIGQELPDGSTATVVRDEIMKTIRIALSGTSTAPELVMIDKATIECVLLDHVDLHNRPAGEADPSLAELATVYKRLTGWDAAEEWAKHQPETKETS